MLLCVLNPVVLKIFKFAPPKIKQVELKQIPQPACY